MILGEGLDTDLVEHLGCGGGCEESETAKSTPQRRRVERRQELLLVIEEENEKPVPKIQWNGSPS